MTDTEKRQCSARVPRGAWGYSEDCQKSAVVERDGKWYCKIHDPEYIKAKNQKWRDKFDKAWAEGALLADLDRARRTATEGLSTDELKALTPALLRATIPMRDALEALIFQFAVAVEHPYSKDKAVYEQAEKALEQAKEGEKHENT